MRSTTFLATPATCLICFLSNISSRQNGPKRGNPCRAAKKLEHIGTGYAERSEIWKLTLVRHDGEVSSAAIGPSNTVSAAKGDAVTPQLRESSDACEPVRDLAATIS